MIHQNNYSSNSCLGRSKQGGDREQRELSGSTGQADHSEQVSFGQRLEEE